MSRETVDFIEFYAGNGFRASPLHFPREVLTNVVNNLTIGDCLCFSPFVRRESACVTPGQR